SLLGRETTQPAAKLLTPHGKRPQASKARIDLADVPFVPLRNLFREELGRLPGGFRSLQTGRTPSIARRHAAGHSPVAAAYRDQRQAH
ncbi:MAG: hypothetical protein C4294_17055, partial [Nitrospiraceae bacterium]